MNTSQKNYTAVLFFFQNSFVSNRFAVSVIGSVDRGYQIICLKLHSVLSLNH